MQRNCRGTSKCLQSCWGFGEACFGVLKVSCCGRGIMGFTKFGDKRVNDLDLLSGYVVGVACLHAKIHAGGSACSSLPVRLDHLFFTCRFCLQCFVPLPSAVFSYVQNPQTNLVNVCAQLISLWNEHFFGDTFDVLCFHMYKLQAYFENISVLRILLEKAMP